MPIRKRVPFSEIFTIHQDGRIEPKKQIRVGGVSIGPGVRLSKGVSVSGVDLSLFVGRDIEVEEQETGITDIIGIYD